MKKLLTIILITLCFQSDAQNDPPVPIELLYAHVTRSNDTLTFKWATASEYDNDYFVLQGSYITNEWSTLVKVFGNGTSRIIQYYEAKFKNTEPCYYRLLQIDYDGTTKQIWFYNDMIGARRSNVQIAYYDMYGRYVDQLTRGLKIKISDGIKTKIFQQ